MNKNKPLRSPATSDIQTGKFVKPAPGVVRIGFPTPFKAPPVVVISPFWENAGNVGFVETITRVETNFFEVMSPNAAPNYYISWMAYGIVQ